MSYVRYGKTSDVYIFGTMENFECILSHDVAHFESLPQYFSVPYGEHGEHLRTMIGHLYYLRHLGVRVPEAPISRMLHELREHYDDLAEAELQAKEEGAGEAG